jgi:hypothetical protein
LKCLADIEETLHDFVLYCTPEELNRRKRARDGDEDDYQWVSKSLQRSNAIKIDTTGREPAEIAQEIAAQLGIRMKRVQPPGGGDAEDRAPHP